MCVCVCEGSRACLQLFTYDGFSTQDDPPPVSFPPHVALCSAQLSLSCFFSPLLLFSASFHPHVCLPFMPQTFHPLLHPPPHSPPTLNHHHPSLYTSLPISRYPISTHGLTSNGCVSPPFSCLILLPSKLCSTIALPTKQSPLMSGKPVGIQALLLIIAFTGNPHCLALP